MKRTPFATGSFDVIAKKALTRIELVVYSPKRHKADLYGCKYEIRTDSKESSSGEAWGIDGIGALFLAIRMAVGETDRLVQDAKGRIRSPMWRELRLTIPKKLWRELARIRENRNRRAKRKVKFGPGRAK